VEIGHLQEVSKSYADKGVVVLGFDSAHDPAFAEELLKENGVTFANVLDASDEAKRVAYDLYRVNAVPTSYVIGRDGRIVAAFTGYAKGDRRGIDAVEDALAAAEVPPEREAGVSAPAAGTVSVTVRGPDGAPLAGATVRLHPTLRSWQEGVRPVSAKTDGAGSCTLRDVAPAAYEVSVQVVRPRSWVAPAGTLRVRGDRGAELAIRIPDTEISGRILRAGTGEPLDSDAVTLAAEPLDGETHSAAMAWADADGRFTFVGLPAGRYRLRALPRDAKLQEATREVKLADRLGGCDLLLKPQRTGVLRLEVVDAAGKPVEGLSFTLVVGEDAVRTARPRPLGNGVYEFELPVGEREIQVQRGEEWWSVRAPIRENEATKRELRVPAR
jgi:hypothetical protein